LRPNPGFSQVQLPGPRPELSVRTCFDRDVDRFFEALFGIRPLPDYFRPEGLSKLEALLKLLDSQDIEPTGLWYSEASERFGLRVTIHNRGNCRGSSTVRARSIFVPFSEMSLPLPAWRSLRAEPVVFTGEKQVQVEAKETGRAPTTTVQILYDLAHAQGGGDRPLDPDFPESFTGFILSTVSLDPATGIGEGAKEELLLANNHAIDIVRVIPPDRESESLLGHHASSGRPSINSQYGDMAQ
jgi:hypothetical protein